MATRTSHLLRPLVVRPLVALVALVAAMAAILLAYSGASPVHAAPSCSTTSGTTTCTFAPTGKEDTFVVPAGVSSVHVVATGAHGEDSNQGGAPGGRGAQVSADLTVSPGQALYVNVGTNGRVGGFNGGGSSDGVGGTGGGASDVRTISRDRVNTLFSRLIVAGGGGGAGDTGDCGGGLEGAGGDAGSGGGDGKPCPPAAGGGGGGAGTQTAGGAGGTGSGSIDITNGQEGVLGQGGTGASVVTGGGGGGGGLFGGGGGGGADDVGPDGVAAGGGGGGGGSNLVPEGGTATLDDSGNPSIVISYQDGLGEEPPTEPEDKQACKKGGYKEFGFKNQGQCIKAVNANN